MDFSLDIEQQAVADTVRHFVERELMPYEDEVERLNELPEGLADQIRERALNAGLYAARIINLP